jgi:hypothetical protein
MICAMGSAALTTSAAAGAGESGAGATEAEPESERREPPFVGLDVVSGLRTSPAEAEGEAPKEGQAKSLLAMGHYPVAEGVTLGARIPLTTANFIFSQREQRRVTALGNIELSGAVHVPLGRVKSEIELGVALPTARGDEDGAETTTQTRGYANLAAQRFRGFRDNALFAAHRFGVVPGGRLELEGKHLSVEAFGKLEVLVNAGGTPPPPELGELNKTAVELVGGGRVRIDPFPAGVFRFALRSWVAWTLVGEVKEPDRSGARAPRAQVVLDPEVTMVAGKLRSGLGVIVPVGGILGRSGFLAVQLTLGVEL